MFVLALLLLGPVILGAKLLGASWLLALFIGLSLPLGALIVAAVVAFTLDVRDDRARRRRRERHLGR